MSTSESCSGGGERLCAWWSPWLARWCTCSHVCSSSSAESPQTGEKAASVQAGRVAATGVVQKWSSRALCLFPNCMGMCIGSKRGSVVTTLDGAVIQAVAMHENRLPIGKSQHGSQPAGTRSQEPGPLPCGPTIARPRPSGTGAGGHRDADRPRSTAAEPARGSGFNVALRIAADGSTKRGSELLLPKGEKPSELAKPSDKKQKTKPTPHE